MTAVVERARCQAVRPSTVTADGRPSLVQPTSTCRTVRSRLTSSLAATRANDAESRPSTRRFYVCVDICRTQSSANTRDSPRSAFSDP